MAVKLGQITRVEVDDEVTLLLQIDWGQYKKLVREIDALPNNDPETLDRVGEKVCAFIHSIKGVVDAQGNELKEVTPDVLNKFPPGLARKLMRAVQRLGLQEDGGVAPPEEGSGSSPETS